MRDYGSKFPVYLFDPAKGAFHHPLPKMEVTAVLGSAVPGAKRVMARASGLSETSPTVDLAIAVVPAGNLDEHQVLSDHGEGSTAFSGRQTLEPLAESEASIDLPKDGETVLVASLRPGPSSDTDYALFFCRSIALT